MTTRGLAWNGIAFHVPENWELALHRDGSGGVRHLEVEDECAVRLELDWLCAPTPAKAARFMAQSEKVIRRLTSHPHHKTDISGLPTGWHATRYAFRETIPTGRRDRRLSVVPHDLVVAAFTAPDRRLTVSVRLHFLPDDPEDPDQTVRMLTQSFACPGPGQPVRWQAFDIDFTLPPEFQLEGTSFDIGSKLMIFRSRGRRLYLWILSCADRFLPADENATEWVVGFLNARRRVPGILFLQAPDGTVAWRRRRPHVICHRDELSRWCFQYRIDVVRDREKNQLRVAVLNYRNAADLPLLPSP